ncbi:LCP family protein [Streptomyces sp. NPDC060194]|uniref:LCP family protein n=1 Tax=Streptomyces sp. NPDC060194 TaxID=3347069 RepID=UPI00364B17A8
MAIPTSRRILVGALTLTVSAVLVQASDASSVLLEPGGTLRSLPAPEDGLNILLMGTDGRDTITEKERRTFRLGGVACDCTDTLMLVHVSARNDRVSVVGIPRDSYAVVPEGPHKNSGEVLPERPSKINAAFRDGGSELSVRTVQSMTGLDVDRAMQVDFRRFMDGVDDLGGVPVCTEKPLKDKVTALDLAPGRHRLNGGPALQYVRSRHVDTRADLGRIQRQQRFLLALGEEVRKRVAKGRGALTGFASLIAAPAPVGPEMTSGEILDLAYRLRSLKPQQVEFAIVPVSGYNDNKNGTGSTLQWDERAAGEMFSNLAADRPLPRNAGADPNRVPGFGTHVPVPGSKLSCG